LFLNLVPRIDTQEAPENTKPIPVPVAASIVLLLLLAGSVGTYFYLTRLNKQQTTNSEQQKAPETGFIVSLTSTSSLDVDSDGNPLSRYVTVDTTGNF
jgi:hypothetical protein